MGTASFILYYLLCAGAIAVSFLIMPFISTKTLSFGIRIPEGEYHRSELRAIRRSYAAVIVIPSLIMLFAFICAAKRWPAEIEQMFALLTVPMLQLAICFVSYSIGHRRTKDLKEQLEWSSSADALASAPLNQSAYVHRPSPLWFSLYLVILIATLLVGALLYDQLPDKLAIQYSFDGTVSHYADKTPFTVIGFMPAIQFFTLLVFALCYWSINSARREINPREPEISAMQGSIYRFRWSLYIIVGGLLLEGLFFFSQLVSTGLIGYSTLVNVISFGIVLLLIVFALFIALTSGQSGSRIGKPSAQSGSSRIARDDDACWKLGIFYYNKDDPSLFVEKRFGIGWTNNWARPLSWLIFIGIILAAVLLSALTK